MPPVPILAAVHAAPHPMPAAEVVFWLLAAIAVCAAAYSVSIRRHPYRACSKCGESGKHRGTVFTGSFRACNRCGGTGRELRPFARHPGTRGGSPRAFEPGPDRAARRAARREQTRNRGY